MTADWVIGTSGHRVITVTSPVKRTVREHLLKQLNSECRRQANKAAHTIMLSGDEAFVPALSRILSRGRRMHNRIEAAYALRAFGGNKGTPTLERILSDRGEDPKLRAFAAETLAHRHRANSHDVLLRCLEDPSVEVRFWCAFALGQMREKNAVPVLREMARRDHRVLRGWWALSKEARDAIRAIEKPTRKGSRRCIFCSL